jgi:hypothetical protein
MKNRDLVAITSCIGRVAFHTYDQAKAVDKRSRKGSNSERRGAYHCPVCGSWHLGHQSPATKAKRRLRNQQRLDEYESAED